MRSASFAVLLALGLPASGASHTWHILADGSGDAPTIQAGIEGASVGDTVLVGPGTYPEFLDFLGKDILITSSDGPVSTVIDGGTRQKEFVVTFASGESHAAGLQGFTLRSTYLGIWVYDAEPTIIDNVIENNLDGGISIHAKTSSGLAPLIVENRIRTNGGPGGLIGGSISPQILNNIIKGNVANSGGGVFSGASAPITISGNTIVENRALYSGAGIYATGPGLTVSGNLIARNWTSMNVGDGIRLEGSNAWPHHNTVVDNGRGVFENAGRGVRGRPGSSYQLGTLESALPLENLRRDVPERRPGRIVNRAP